MKNDNLSFLERPMLEGDVSVIGIPLDLGKDNIGTDKGPSALRNAGLISKLQAFGLNVNDLGDIVCPDRTNLDMGDQKIKFLDPIVEVCEKVSLMVKEELAKNRKVISLGGDNTISLGTVSGAGAVLKNNLGVIWIDAHGDINTIETSLSGNVHGMPISALLGMGHEKLTSISYKGQKILPENLLYIGLKDLDQAEIDIIREKNISTVTMLDIVQCGLNPAFEKISALSKKVSNIWVCLDVDSIDEEYAPATPMATKGGLTYREVTGLAKYIGKVCNVVGIDVSELAPHLDKDYRTSKLIVELLVSYLGTEANWYTEYMQNEARKQHSVIQKMEIPVDSSSE